MPRVPNTTEDSLAANMPWQVKAIGFIGVPSAIACFLVWHIIGVQDAKLDALVKGLEKNTSAIVFHADDALRAGWRMERVESILGQICAQGGNKTDPVSVKCFPTSPYRERERQP